MEKEILTLGIESSCDETSAAVLRGGRTVLSNVISTQIPIHQKFGGVVPEIASRKHIVNIMPVIDEAVRQAGVTLTDIDQVAVTYGPGLVGALLVGVSAAKALAFALDKPHHRCQPSRRPYLRELPCGPDARAALHGTRRLGRPHGARRCARL